MDQPTTPPPPVQRTDLHRRRPVAGLHPWWQHPVENRDLPSTQGRPQQGRSAGPATKHALRRLRASRSVHSLYGEEGRAFRHTIAALFAQGRWLRLVAELRKAPR